MAQKIEKKIVQFIRQNDMPLSGGNIVLAVSGGADSMALLHIFHKFTKDKTIDSRLIAVHVNHGLRGKAADDDQLFVEGVCKKLSVDFIAERVNVIDYAKENKKSIETAARNLRKDALIRIARENQADVVVTAHQKNDNAETLIHRILRGTAFRGLAGINPKITFDGIVFIRPLLCAGREEILAYLKKNKLTYREDHTNLDTRYKRNFVRHQLLPYMQECSKSDIIEELDILSGDSYKLAQKIDEKMAKLLPAQPDNRKVAIPLSLFDQQHPLLKVELIRAALERLGCGEQGFTEAHYKKIMRLSTSPTHRKLELPSGCCVRLDYDALVFYKGEIEPKASIIPNVPIQLKVPGVTSLGNLRIETSVFDAAGCNLATFRKSKDANTEWFDYDKLNFPLIFRPRREGDRFRPIGLPGIRKVGKIFTDAKIPPSQRAAARIIEDGRKIIWVWPVRCSEMSKVKFQTRKILQIKITQA